MTLKPRKLSVKADAIETVQQRIDSSPMSCHALPATLPDTLNHGSMQQGVMLAASSCIAPH
jgi:hypothetical protein